MDYAELDALKQIRDDWQAFADSKAQELEDVCRERDEWKAAAQASYGHDLEQALRRAEKAEKELGECSGGYQTLVKELAAARDSVSFNAYRALEKERDALQADLAMARATLLFAKDACRLAREGKPIPWSFLEEEFDAALAGEKK